jgi:glutamyl-tRNA synthetase
VIRVRFATALTGHVSVGNARTALANHLFARRENGRMLLRLDDLHLERSRSVSADQVIQDLGWFGIEWQESFCQSDRVGVYRDAIERLKRDKLIYPCFESDEELKAKQDFRRKRNQPTIYDRAMLSLSEGQRRALEAGGRRPHWRFKLSGRILEWNDLILGHRRAALSAVSDPIVVRADGTPAPILASVIDDIAYGTTHVIRGEDSAGNTAVQIELFEVLSGARLPVRFGHLPALTDGGKAAPRGRKVGSLTLRNLRTDGVEPGAIAGCMIETAQEPSSLEHLAQRFDLTDLARSRFDASRMLSLNRQMLGELDFSAVVDRLPAGVTEAFWLAVRRDLDMLREARGWWDVVAGTIVPPVIDGARDLLLAACAWLPPEPWGVDVWTNWISALERATNRRSETLIAPLRLALTGEEHGPDPAELLPLMGRPRAMSRLTTAAA